MAGSSGCRSSGNINSAASSRAADRSINSSINSIPRSSVALPPGHAQNVRPRRTIDGMAGSDVGTHPTRQVGSVGPSPRRIEANNSSHSDSPFPPQSRIKRFNSGNAIDASRIVSIWTPPFPRMRPPVQDARVSATCAAIAGAHKIRRKMPRSSGSNSSPSKMTTFRLGPLPLLGPPADTACCMNLRCRAAIPIGRN